MKHTSICAAAFSAAFLAMSGCAVFAQAGPPQGSVQPSPGGPDATKQDLNKTVPGTQVAPSSSTPPSTTGVADAPGVKGNVNPGSQKSGSEPAGEPANQPRR